MSEVHLTPEIQYVLVIFGLFIVSRYIQRYKLPSAITCLGLGVLFGMELGIFQEKETVKVFAVLGIVAMFLFAGMEIKFEELRKAGSVIVQHLVIQAISITGASYIIIRALELQLRPALLIALAVMTPSTGFILDSLPGLPVSDDERFWIKSKAIATEILALLILFFILQSASISTMATSIGVMAIMIVALPLLFKGFAAKILPYAPKTEFAFLIIIALICAAITKKLGVYYLVGAFLVGIVQQQVRTKVPALDSPNILHAVDFFAGFFIPFYFFQAGLSLRPDNFTLESLKIAGILLATVIPFRVGTVALHRRISLGEAFGKGMRTGTALLPTLVFTLVLAGILKESFSGGPELVGGLVIFTIVNTMIPAFVLKKELIVPPKETDSFSGYA